MVFLFHLFAFLQSHGGTGAGSTQRPILAALA
ncbi:MAG: hypothetical protein ACD_74C00137G0010, partial [uncultured bacterium]